MGEGALAGVVVIDLTRVLGGPYCTQVLGDNGAEVVKLEPPQGDEVRDWGPPFDDAGDASYFLGINRNKRSLALALGRPAGRDALLRLLEQADVLVENFKPGTLEQLGLGDDELVDAVAHDVDRAVKRLLRDLGLLLGRPRLVDELDAALEVEAELRRLGEDHRQRCGEQAHDREQDEDVAAAIGHESGGLGAYLDGVRTSRSPPSSS